MSFLCRLGHHQPSRRSQLDLRDQQVKTYCKRCGAVMVLEGKKWRTEESQGAREA